MKGQFCPTISVPGKPCLGKAGEPVLAAGSAVTVAFNDYNILHLTGVAKKLSLFCQV